jgi:hypothetical protein
MVLVLWAWALMVVAGVVVQKESEHWQSAIGRAGRHEASQGFTLLVGAAVGAAVLVAVGIAVALPATVRFLRGGGFAAIREPALTAAALSVIAVAALAGLVIWARHADRSTAYAIAFVTTGLLCATALAAWTALATALARRITLRRAIARAETALAALTALALPAIAAGTALWWWAIAHHAPGFLNGDAAPLIVALTAMLIASALAATGAWSAVKS